MTPRLFVALLGSILVTAASTAPAVAADTPPPSTQPTTPAGQPGAPTDLKVTRVAVFSSGVAFFECDGKVAGNATSELRFRTEQINDILKSLVVEDLDGGTVGVVSYASRDPIERTLKSFAVDITKNPTLLQLFDQLRGEPITIAGPRQLTGTVLGVEVVKKTVGPEQIVEVAMLNILTDQGLQSLPLHELEGIKLTNEKIAKELRAALATLAAGREADKKTVTVNFDGQGQRRVKVMYLLEAPIWKTSYRLVLMPENKAYMQGWATVENATEEDWKDVNLSLVSGRPISFRMDLYTPLYVQRPMEELELYASLRPPTYEGAMDADMLGERGGRTGGARGAVARSEASARTTAAAPPPAAAETIAGSFADDLSAMRQSVRSVAEGVDVGELFQYPIATPVSIGRQRSAMLPIVGQEIEARKVSIFNPASHPKYPLNGLLLKNTSGLSLMQGPVTVFDGGTYAGDAKLPNLQANEERLMAYALDLSVEGTIRNQNADVEVGFRIGQGVLYRKVKATDEREYVFKNRDKDERTLLIEQPRPNNWTLVEPNKPYEETASLWRFELKVPAGQSASQKVRIEQTREESVILTTADMQIVEIALRSRVINDKVKAALQKVLEMRRELDKTIAQRTDAERNVKEAVAEQERIRANLQTLDKQTDQYRQQLQKFSDAETQITTGRTKVDELRKSEQKQRDALTDYLGSLTVE
jgi:hypothetical protein